jgi:hypothetical protein
MRPHPAPGPTRAPRAPLATTVAALLASSLACTAPNPEYAFARHDAGSPDATDAGTPETGADRGPGADGRAEAGSDGLLQQYSTNLIGYWKLDEAPGSMTVLDSSGMGHHGTLENLDAARVWIAGRRGGAIEIAGDDHASGIRVPLTPAIAGLQRFTVAAWAYRFEAAGDYASVISRQLGTSQYEVFNLSFTGSLVSIYLAAGSPSTSYPFVTRSKKSTPAGRWIHVAATFDGRVVRLYLEGVQENSMDYPRAMPASSTPLYLGTNQNDSDGEPMAGRLDDILLYSEALSPQAIAELAAGMAPPGL